MRGKPGYDELVFSMSRITPARAGKTQSIRPHVRIISDHPRACGENLKQSVSDSRKEGSPPRVRGKLSESKHC